MLTSPQIKMVKLLHKKPGISDRSSFRIGVVLNFNRFERNGVTTFPWPGCFKSMLAYVIHAQIPKILHAYEQDVPYGTFYKNDDLSVSAT